MSKKILVQDVEPLIEQLNGNVSAIARKLGVARNTVYARIAESVTLQQKLDDARQTMVDNAESALYREVLNGNMTAIIFFLKTQGKSRGYTERQDVHVHTWQDDVIDLLQRGEIDPDEVRAAYPDLATELFTKAGIRVSD